MSSNHDNGENGRLEEDLDRVSRAYARLEAEEPPELLDLAIRNSARHAVEKKPRRIKFGWMHGLTTAAVFVLALSVIMHQRENQPASGNGLQFDRGQPAPAASPAKMQPAASEPRDQALGEALRESRQKVAAAPVQQSSAADTGEDQVVLDKTVEKKEAEKPAAESMADAPEDAGQAMTAKPAIVSAPPPAGPESRSDIGLEAEKRLQSIIAMKRNGDERWKKALKDFIDDHPDYPLPDELLD